MGLEGRLLGGRYRIRNLLGSGGMGAVYAAEQEDLHKPVAVKVLLSQKGISPAALARFKREALAVAKLGHPNIVQVTDFQAWPEEPAILVMEMLRGESLHALLAREERLSQERAVFIVTQILAALAAAHAAGIIHRDIKPANIFLTRTPAVSDLVKVLDFGIAKAPGITDGFISEPNAVLGTPAYMAPEQAQAGVGDHRADLYSVGVCLFEMLVGRRPHAARTLGEVLAFHAANRPIAVRTLAPELDGKLADVIESALSRDPRHRPQRALDMLDMLDAGGGGGDLATLRSDAHAEPPPNVTAPLTLDTSAATSLTLDSSGATSLTLDTGSAALEERGPVDERAPATARMAPPLETGGPVVVVAPPPINVVVASKTLLMLRSPSPRPSPQASPQASPPAPPNAGGASSTHGELARAATRSLVVSIVGLVLFFLLPVGLVGVVMGLHARSIAARLRVPLPAPATLGIVLGLLGSAGFVGSCGFLTMGKNIIKRKQAESDARIVAIEQALGDKAQARDLDRETACRLSELFLLRNGFRQTKGYEIANVECAGAIAASNAAQAALGDVRVGTPEGRVEMNVCFRRGPQWVVSEARKEPCPTADGGS